MSLDDPAQQVRRDMLTDAAQQGVAEQHARIREGARRKSPATFGPWFAQKVIRRIQAAAQSTDELILQFFRRYQLAAIGLVVALLAFNALAADKLSMRAILGIEDTATTESTDAETTEGTFDYFSDLNNN